MKKVILATLCILIGSIAFAQEVEEESTTIFEGGKSTDEKVVAQVIRKNRSKDFNHWMLSIGGGFNMIICERTGDDSKDPLKNYRDNFQGAGYFNVGYMINPVWGVVAEYGLIPINKKIYTDKGDKTGFAHEATIQMDFNILNLVRKCRKSTKWNIDALVGVGFLAYKQYDFSTDERNSYYPALCVPVTLKFQYCPIDELGIGLRITGKWYSEDDLNTLYSTKNSNNDMALYAGLELQYNVTTKGKKHVRVTDRCTYEPMDVVLQGKIVDVNKNSEKIDEIEKDLDEVKNDVSMLGGGTARLDTAAVADIANDKIKELQQRIDSLEAKLGNINVAGNNVYDPTIINNNTNIINQYNEGDNGIFFEFDSDKIMSEYYKEVKIIAKRMLNNNKLKIKIIGYCDSQGSVEYNKDLAKRRIDALAYLLINRYRIAKERIFKENVGRIEGENEIDDLNRRIDVEYFY